MRAYYATKLTPNISRMPNGFLVCKNVPIARTGTQEYQGLELGVAERPDEMFPVFRVESEVFTPAALASFEGVPLVDEHPDYDVTVENACNLMRGFVKDVRRGEGDDFDKMIADIIVTDPTVIAEIENGKREVSCGYKCDYETAADGHIYQRNIRGNHVALVYKGRAGQNVAIKDSESQSKPKSERRTKFMSKQEQSKEKFSDKLAKLFGLVTTDADPVVVAELAEHLLNASGEGGPPAADLPADATPPPTEAPPPVAGSEEPPAWAKALITELSGIKAALSAKAPDVDPLDALEKEVSGSEENVTKPVEEMDDDDGAALDASDTGDANDAKDKTTTSNATAARDAIANAKKQVAKIQDHATRRSVSDSMATIIRQAYGITPSTPKGSYAKILAAKQEKAKLSTDAYPAFDSMEIRQSAYDSRNPHIKKEAK